MEMKLDMLLSGSSVLDKIYTTANTEKIVGGENIVINNIRAVELLSIRDIIDILTPHVESYNDINTKIIKKYADVDEDGEVIKKRTDMGDAYTISDANRKKYNNELVEVLKTTKDINFKPLSRNIINNINNINGIELNALMLFIES